MYKFLATLVFLFSSYAFCDTFERLSLLQELRFQGVLSYANGYDYTASSLLKQYLLEVPVNARDWKVYVVYYLTRKRMNSCDFSPLTEAHKATVVDSEWYEEVTKIESNCSTR